MILLRLISWPYIRKHLLRTVLTTAGIVLGVALLVGMQSANRSVLAAFNQTVDRIAGKAQLQVSAGESGFSEDVLEKVQALPEVQNAAPVIEAVVDTGLAAEGKLLILAVDMTGDGSLRDYDFESADDAIDDPLIFLAQPDSLIVTREFAARNGLNTGSKIAFDTMEGRKHFTVRGILKAGGMAAAFGGSLGIMDIYAAQKVFGRGRRFDRIDVALREGIAVAQGQAALAKTLGEGFDVEPPSGRGRQFESLLGIYTLAMSVSSMFALFIGLFIIYNSFAIAVTQRRSEIGILRALGATRGQIRSLFLGESAIAGVIGSAAGVAVGLAFTRSLTGATGQLMETMFGVPANTRDILIPWWFLLGAFASGVVTSIVAALIPARNAARLQPVQALQKGRYQVLGAGENRMRRNIALVAVAISVACFPLSGYYRPAFYVGALLTVVAALLLTPFLSLELARLLRYPLKWLRPVEGSLAADSLIQAPRRTSATVAALMLSLALAIAHGGVSLGSVKSIGEWMTGTLNPDLFVSASHVVAAHDFRFPPSMEAELAQIPGIDEVHPVRTARVKFRGQPIMIVAGDVARISRRIDRIVISGDLATMDRMNADGSGVIIAENLANLQKIKVGDTFEIAAPVEPVRLPVVGITRDYSNQLGTVFIDRKVYVKHFNDDTIDIFRVYLKPRASAEEARKSIQERLGSQRRLFVMMNHEVRKYVEDAVNQWLGMTYLQVFVALIVGILGIINTLTVSISDRRRELGVLRAVGGLRAQIRGTVWLESVAIGVIGLVLGIATGAVFLYYELEAIGKDIAGTPLPYEFPFGITALLLPVILAASLISAILPGETAVRSSLVEALEYE